MEDQVVLQAVADIFADRLRHRRSRVEGQVVFSNILNGQQDSIFFLADWRTTYARFLKRAREHFEGGSVWVADFDFAAFYDTISHDQLLRMVAPRGGEAEFWNRVGKWFRTWTGAEASPEVGHGIPQGPIASDFLAECFLLPLDEALLAEGVQYLRYVDDILIFAATQVEAQRAAVYLEGQVRNLGLIPHAGKFGIRRVSTFENLRDKLPSLADPLRVGAPGERVLPPSEALEEAFRSGVGGRPLQVTDKSRVRYALFRIGKSEEILRRVLRLLPRHPEEIDAFAAFLSNYETSVRIERVVSKALVDGIPYDYVRGELWHILGRICRDPDRRKGFLDLARRDLRERTSVGLRWGALAFLLGSQSMGLCRRSGHLLFEDPLLQSLLVPVLPDSEFTASGVVPKLLRGTDMEAGLVLAEPMTFKGLSLQNLGVTKGELPDRVQNAFKASGLLPTGSTSQVDEIAVVLRRRFRVRSVDLWRKLLGSEYRYALQLLLRAEAVYESGRSHWLQLQDSFDDATTRALLDFLLEKGHLAGRDHRNRNGNLIDFGVLLDPNQSLSQELPVVGAALKLAHDRRNQLPGSHPYQKKGGDRSRYLRAHEQAYIARELRKAYEEIQVIVLALGI